MPLLEVNRIFGILSSQLSAIQSFGYTVCIQAPKNTLIFCFSVQKEIAYLPFRCARMIFDTMTSLLRRLRAKSEPPNIAEILTGTSSPTLDQVRVATRNINAAALSTIVNKTSAKRKVAHYREELDKWSSENDKKILESYALNTEDKEMLKTLAIRLHKLKALKARKSNINATYYQTVLNIVTKDHSSEELKTIKKNREDIAAIMEETKNECLTVINGSSKWNHLFTKIVLQSDSFSNANQQTCDAELPVCVPNKIKRVSNVRVENAVLKCNLASTNEKLEEILNATENIRRVLLELCEQFTEIPRLNNEVLSLRAKLEEGQRELRELKDIEIERNGMKEKLELLETLINEEEGFLDSRSETPSFEEFKGLLMESTDNFRPTLPATEHPFKCLL